MAGSGAFRKFFYFPHKDMLNWFPGHMGLGMRMMQQKLRSVDGLIEVHDARIPLSGRNPLFPQKISRVRPHLLLLNKADLADLTRKEEIVNTLKCDGVSKVLYTNAKMGGSEMSQVIPTMIDLIKANIAAGFVPASAKAFTLMVIGVPNVGKSSFINYLRRTYAKRAGNAPVGAMPGITRTVQQFITVSERPKINVIDTPGIAHPSYKNVEEAMRLALCHVMNDDYVGKEKIVDYLLFWSNKRCDVRYVNHFGLKDTVDDVTAFLAEYAHKSDLFCPASRNAEGALVMSPDLLEAARKVLADFRSGAMGKFMLDDDRLLSKDEVKSSRARRYS